MLTNAQHLDTMVELDYTTELEFATIGASESILNVDRELCIVWIA